MLPHSPRACPPIARSNFVSRRQALSSTCLLAFPAALALGHPALAQTNITTNQASTLNLVAGQVNILSGVSITSTGQAAISGATLAQLSNAGNVADASGTGIYLGAGGSLGNTGSISGANAVRFNAAGSLANAGVITGTNYGVLVNNGTGHVGNTGSIAAGDDGISLNDGGTVTNSGSIFGAHLGVYTGNALGSVTNSGIISARSGDAVSLYSGGSLTNLAGGQLIGGYAGVYAGGTGAQITNAGLITGPEFGAYLMGNTASLTNAGTIAGGVDGVNDLGRGALITNTGLIHGGQIGVKLATGGAVDNAGIITGGTTGVKLGNNSMLANEASGHITGGMTAVVAATGDVLRNSGTITGQTGISASGAVSLVNNGVIASTEQGGNAISLSGGASSITLGTGSKLYGNIAGGGTASQITLTGSGTLISDITGFAAGSSITVQQSAVWSGAGQWQVAQLVNNGVFTPGAIGTPLSLTGNFVQSSTGVLSVLVSPGGISSFAITGTATLGGTLRYMLAPGSFVPGSDVFLAATGGVTGNFATVTSTQTGVQATPLHLTVATVIAVTNTPESSTAVDNPAASAVVVSNNAITFTSNIIVVPSGAGLFADTTQAMALGAFASGQALLDHAVGYAAGGNAGDACQALPATGTGQTANMASALASGICAAGGWMQVTGNTASATGAYTIRGGGFLAGVDRANGIGGRIGVAVGYDTDNLSDKSGGTAGLQTIRLGIYAAQPLGRFALSADIMDGIVSRNTTRYTGAAAATAKGHGNVFSGDVQIALPLTLGGGTEITPALGAQIVSVTAGRLSETSATQAFAVNVASASGTTAAPYLSLTVQKQFITASNLTITPDVTAGVTTMLNNPGANTELTAQDGTAFITHPEHMAPISGQISTGITITKRNWSITARYTGEAGGNWSGQSLQAGVQVRF